MTSNLQCLNKSKRLLSINDCTIEDLSNIFSIAESGNFKLNTEGLFISVFFENSTRTLLSFEKSALNCGLTSMRFDVSSSSIAKEETEINTIRTLNELSAKAIVLRCKKSGEPSIYANYISENTAIINAGDGTNEHPTQSLLDTFTILQETGNKFSQNCFKGLKIAIMGDVSHSRVARSNIFLLSKLGAEVTLIFPPNFLGQNFIDFYTQNYNIKVTNSYQETFDFVMLLRVQKERIEGSGKICYPSKFGIFTEAELKGAKLMHPGPLNVGVETSEELAYSSKNSLISKQVSNGVLIRSAILKYLVG